MRLAAVAAMGAAAALVAFPAAADASAPAGPSAAGAAGMIRYAEPNPAATHVVLQGTRVAGGCAFTATGTGTASTSRHNAVRQVETAYDAASCTSYADRLTVPATRQSATADAVRSGGGSRAGASRAAVTAESAVSPLVARCLNPYRNTTGSFSRDACIHSWFQDPNAVHVTDVRNEVQWNPAAGCASYGVSSTSYYWAEQSGWFNTLDRFSSTYACAGVTSQTSEGFQHNTYCSGSAATTTYDPGYITGHADGSYNWSVTWRKTGSCQLAFGLLDES